MIPPFRPRGFTEHPPPRDERPYGDRTAEELECEPEWVIALYLGYELVPGGGVSTPVAPGTHQDGAGLGETSREAAPWDRDPLSPVQAPTTDGAVTTALRAPGGAAPSVQDADGAVEAPLAAAPAPFLEKGCERPSHAAPSVQTPPSLPVDATGWGRGGGPDVVAWAATLTALVITTVYAAVRVAQWHVIGGR